MIDQTTRERIHELVYRVKKLKSDFSIFLSRVLLSNEGGLDLFVLGKIKLFWARLCFNNNSASYQADDVLLDLRRNKVAKVDLNIPSKTLETIRTKIEQHIENPKYSQVRGSRYGNTEKKYYTRILKDAVFSVSEIKDILTPELCNTIQDYFKSNIGITSVLIWRNYHVDESEGNKVKYSNDWHYDYIAPTELKLFINMTDVTEDHGPLHVIPHLSSVKLYQNKIFRGRHKENNIEAIEATSDLIKHTGNAGSAVFTHASYCLHRADIPKKGKFRDMLEIQFHPSSNPLDSGLYKSL